MANSSGGMVVAMGRTRGTNESRRTLMDSYVAGVWRPSNGTRRTRADAALAEAADVAESVGGARCCKISSLKPDAPIGVKISHTTRISGGT